MKRIILQLDHEDNKVADLSIFHTTWIYRVLKCLGFSLFKEIKEEPIKKARFGHVSKLLGASSIFLHVAFAYSVVAIVTHDDVISTKHCIVNILCLSLSTLLWHYIQIKSEKFSHFFAKIRKLSNSLDVSDKREIIATNVIITVAFIHPVVISMAITSAVGRNVEEKYFSFWLLGYQWTSYKFLRSILTFVAMILFFSAKFLVPALCSTVYGAICYKLSKAIRFQSLAVEENIKSERFFAETKVYHFVIRCCEKFEDSAKGMLFLIFFAYSTAIYTGLEMIMGQAKIIPSPAADIDAILTLLSCGVPSISLMLLGSKIPEAMTAAKLRFQYVHRKALVGDNGHVGICPKQLVLLKALGRIKPLSLTAAKMLKIDKSLILTSFGCALTYCILIRQLEKN
ncbi:hypothetical protein JTE90_004263 [Oedothorax gibbosus]|uniref:Gustatory receptor n=1 Tax=Oedothorax gibbosus TaxID=931172 RepID=A0AAV6UFC0_9ARAC|nr:hypothetical protein JTE90_004263 [Oedothorax gibbosus]